MFSKQGPHPYIHAHIQQRLTPAPNLHPSQQIHQLTRTWKCIVFPELHTISHITKYPLQEHINIWHAYIYAHMNASVHYNVCSFIQTLIIRYAPYIHFSLKRLTHTNIHANPSIAKGHPRLYSHPCYGSTHPSRQLHIFHNSLCIPEFKKAGLLSSFEL